MLPYFQSLVWLVGFSGVGYVLMELTKPNEAKLNAIRNTANTANHNERDRQKELFMQKLKEAAQGKPVYLKRPQELVDENRRQH